MAGEGEINGDFSASFIIGNKGAVTDSLPVSTGGHAGELSNNLLKDHFSGKLTLPESKSSKRNEKRAVDLGGTILALNFISTSQMELEISFYGQEEHAAVDVEFNQTVHSLLRIKRESNGNPRVDFSNQKGFVESYTRGELPWGDDESQYSLQSGKTLVLHDEAATPADRNAPETNGYALFWGP